VRAAAFPSKKHGGTLIKQRVPEAIFLGKDLLLSHMLVWLLLTLPHAAQCTPGKLVSNSLLISITFSRSPPSPPISEIALK
jgi:hypothetical protein